MLTPEKRAREFVEVGFRDLGVPSLEPYIAIIAELIAGAENDAMERAAKVAAANKSADVFKDVAIARDIRAMKHP